MIRNYRKLFEAEFSLDLDDEYDDIYVDIHDKREMCGYTWSRIGEINGDSLYLCDDIVKKMDFSTQGIDDWRTSDIRRWLNTEFYRKIPSEYKDRIVKHNGDNLFLLSVDEYNKFRNNISNIHAYWWLRSPGINSKGSLAAHVRNDGSVNIFGFFVYNNPYGVRPALLLKEVW